jgi:hypothetical protein
MPLENSLVTVVIPIHLPEPSSLEKISLAQTLEVLGRHPITFVAPEGLDTNWYESYCRGKATIHIERFRWRGREGYGKLMTSSHTYARFLAYQFILICHLDAFVFRDELEEWCKLDYDYIGAVILNPAWDTPNSTLRKVTGFTLPQYFGNGGFSLRKVKSFYRITSRFNWYIKFYSWRSKRLGAEFIEDIFLSHHFPKLSSSFRMPPKDLALRFGVAYENWPEEKLPFSNQHISSLPFGNHGWIQFHQNYWKPCIRHFGHAI